MKIKETNRGISLVEGIVYVAVLGLLLAVIVQSLLSLVEAQSRLAITGDIEVSGRSAMETMIREIRDAESVDTANSVLDSHPGTLKINIPVSDTNFDTASFYLTDGTLYINRNDAVEGPLTSPGVTVENLVFRQTSNTHSEAVKIEMTIHASRGTASSTKKFFGSAVLRESY